MHFEHNVSSFAEPQHLRAGVAHREADGGEYHPSTKVFYQVSLKLPRPASPSTPSIFEGEFGYNARGRECRQAMQTRRCGGIPADLTFLVLFWSSKKVQRESHERLLNEVGRASMHALTQGTISLASGGNFWQGAATGMASSLIGSATSSFPVWAQIGVSTVTGGATSKLSGGTFWEGAVTGFAVSAFNHAMHAAIEGREMEKMKKMFEEKAKAAGFVGSLSTGIVGGAIEVGVFIETAGDLGISVKELNQLIKSAAIGDAKALKILKTTAGGLKILGALGGGISLAISLNDLRNDTSLGKAIQIAIQGAAIGTAFIPGVGWAISVGLTVFDTCAGDYLYNWIDGKK